MKFTKIFTIPLLTLVAPAFVFAADKSLNTDQFLAPMSSSPAPKTTVGGPVGSAPTPVKVVPTTIQGLQSDVLLKAYLAAPDRVPAKGDGKDQYGNDHFTCTRGYYCESVSGAGVGTVIPTCVKDRFIYDQGERGVCSRTANWAYGGRDTVEVGAY